MTKIIFRKRHSPFIKKFDSTPEGVVCPHFYILAHANGCLYDCAYCYLKHTMRNTLIEGTNKPAPNVFTNTDDIKKELATWGEKTEPSILNAGELADSFMDVKYLQVLFESFAYDKNVKKHTLLFVTKGGKNVVDALRQYPALDNVIVSFSVSTNAGMYEMGAPDVTERLVAAKMLSEFGWRIRLRIDPLVPEELAGRKVDSQDEIIKCVNAKPERITLGSLRFSYNWRYHKWLRKATSESDYCGYNNKAYKMRLPLAARKTMYESVLAALRTYGYEGWVGFCKETLDIYKHFNLDPKEPVCNCSLHGD
ncbi:MAG: hypothetical protein GF375_04945 [Candidatus Omnitrophica bacterium]|nr:hypothetical protein [Candidatus Omnitrophota bacterium]